jgi:hypothetical protein
MQTLLEPTCSNLDAAVCKPGTHYFRVSPDDAQSTRQYIYNSALAGGRSIGHTTYNRDKQTLRVVVNG